MPVFSLVQKRYGFWTSKCRTEDPDSVDPGILISAFHFTPPRHPLKRSPFRKPLAPPALQEIVSRGPPAKWRGIDFGARNPFAAVWSFFDPSGIFWLLGYVLSTLIIK
jgi:hypothetical protein